MSPIYYVKNTLELSVVSEHQKQNLCTATRQVWETASIAVYAWAIYEVLASAVLTNSTYLVASDIQTGNLWNPSPLLYNHGALWHFI